MTIQEAIKTGKPFARPCMDEEDVRYIVVNNEAYEGGITDEKPMWVYCPPIPYTSLEWVTPEDVLADDWQIYDEEEYRIEEQAN